jgi:hypothetical protein
MMDAGNTNRSRDKWATTLTTAMLIVVVGTFAAVWQPMQADGNTGSAVTPATPSPDMSVYFPARFPAPENVEEQQAPTF